MTTTNRPRTHVRLVRENEEYPSMSVAYRSLIGTAGAITTSEAQRIRLRLRTEETVRDSHGFTWKSVGGTVAESTIAWSDFTFGVEIECLMPESISAVSARVSAVGFGGWNVVRDGSLHGAPGYHTMEIVSPVLQGDVGVAQLREVLDFIKSNGGRVNSSCGIHVHVGVRGMKVSRLRKIAISFLNNEANFDRVMPNMRLANRYCQSNLAARFYTDHARAVPQELLPRAQTVSTIARAMNGGFENQHYTHHRYYKLNFQSFLRHGTIEFRQHSGSVEAEKVAQWVRLVTGFCAAAASQPEQQLREPVAFDAFLVSSTTAEGVAYYHDRAERFARTRRAA